MRHRLAGWLQTRRGRVRPEDRARVRARLRYLWREMQPDAIELLSACLSLWFMVALLWPHDTDHRNGPAWAGFWGLLCGTAGILKIVGVTLEIAWARSVGLIVGAGFWLMFAVVFGVTVHGGVTWGGFVILSAAQCWCLWRVRRP